VIVTTEELIGRYRDAMAARGFAVITQSRRVLWMRRFVRFLDAVGKPDLVRVTADEIEAWRLELVRVPTKKGLPRRLGTVNNAMVTVRSFYRLLFEADVIAHNPGAQAEAGQDAAAAAAACADRGGDTASDRIRGSIDAAWRPATGRCWNFSTAPASAWVSCACWRSKTSISSGACAASAAARAARGASCPSARRRRSSSPTTSAGCGPASCTGRTTTALWLNQWGLRLTEWAIRRRVRQSARAAGIERRLTPHGLRHACATHLLEHRADLRHIQELLGHVSVETTQIYTHVSVKHLRETLARCHPREKDPLRDDGDGGSGSK